LSLRNLLALARVQASTNLERELPGGAEDAPGFSPGWFTHHIFATGVLGWEEIEENKKKKNQDMMS
jgi:hypothetical protein